MRSRWVSALTFLVLVAGGLLFSGCGQLVAPQTGWVEGYVSDKKGGDPVPGVVVRVLGGKAQTTTNEHGYYRIQVPAGIRGLSFAKEGYAGARVEGLWVKPKETTYYSTLLLEAFDPTLPTTPPKIRASNPIVDGDQATFTLSVEVAEPERNALTFTDVAVGAVGGSSGHLNKTVRHRRMFGYHGERTEIEVSLAGFSGLVPIHIVSYDLNHNRAELIRYAKVEAEEEEPAPAAPSDLAALALTFGDVAVFGPLGHTPARAALEEVRQGKLAGLKTWAPLKNLAPMADERLKKAVSWVELTFNYPEDAPAPDYFEIWRKRNLEGEDRYHLVARATPEETAVEGGEGYLFRDATPGVEPGVELEYKVVAIKGGKEAASEPVKVTPLPAFEVEAKSPADHATNVPRSPLYVMEVKHSADINVIAVIVLDRIQADPSFAYVSPLLFLPGADGVVDPFGLGGIPHGLVEQDDSYALAEMPLAPYHAYDWQPLALTLALNDQGELVGASIAADFFNFLGDAFDLPLGVRDGPVHTFVTGAE